MRDQNGGVPGWLASPSGRRPVAASFSTIVHMTVSGWFVGTVAWLEIWPPTFVGLLRGIRRTVDSEWLTWTARGWAVAATASLIVALAVATFLAQAF